MYEQGLEPRKTEVNIQEICNPGLWNPHSKTSQLIHVRIRYHFLAGSHITRYARETEIEKPILWIM